MRSARGPTPFRSGDSPSSMNGSTVNDTTVVPNMLNSMPKMGSPATPETEGQGPKMVSQAEMLLGTQRPRPTKLWKKRFVKIMMVGDSGLGKTTLIRTLLSGPGDKLELHDGSETSHKDFLRNPNNFCSKMIWEDDEDRTTWVYSVQDTPGYGDDLNIMTNIQKMRAFVDECNEKWLSIEQDRRRGVDMTDVEDPRIDLCIFCLPPHRLRNIDIIYMHTLSQVVPIVPVITKADTMTIREAAVHRATVASRLQHPAIPGLKGPIQVFQFEDDTLDRAGVSMENGMYRMPPFLVVASNDINKEKAAAADPIYWPQRQYKWGTSEAFNPEHSDLLNLRALLFQEACEEIADTKRNRFEKWRVKHLAKKTPMQKFRGLLATIMVTTGFAIGAFTLYQSPYGEPARKWVGGVSKKIPQLPWKKDEPKAQAKGNVSTRR